MEQRKMRRSAQQLTEKETIDILVRGTAGVLAVQGDGGYPYSVPVSYAYHDNTIYLHGAKTGYKLDCIRRDPKVSFCVIDEDRIVPSEFTTYFRSAIAFGKARVVSEPNELWDAMMYLGEKYSPGDVDGREKETNGAMERLCVVAIDVESMTGKEAIEFVRARVQN